MKVARAWQKVYLLTLAAFAFTGEEAGECLRAVTYLEWWFPLKTPSAVFGGFLIGEHLSFWWPDLTLDGSSRKSGATLSLVSSRRKSGSRTQNSFFSRRTEPENAAPPPESSWLFSNSIYFASTPVLNIDMEVIFVGSEFFITILR